MYPKNKRNESYYADSQYEEGNSSLGNGRTYPGKFCHNPDQYREEDSDSYQDANYDDGYDDNYASPAYTMGSGNFNAGRRNDKDTANMFKPSNYHNWSHSDGKGTDYDTNYSEKHEEDDHLYNEHRSGRYHYGFLNPQNREGESGHEYKYPGKKTSLHTAEKTYHYFIGYTGHYVIHGGDFGYYNRER